MDSGHVILSQIALLITLSALGGLGGLLNGLAFQRQLEQVKRRLVPPGFAYRRFLIRGYLQRLLFIGIALTCCIISFFVISATNATTGEPFSASSRWYAVGLLPIFWVSIVIYNFVAEGATGAESAQLVGIKVTRRQTLAFRSKVTLLSVPISLLAESLIAVFLLGLPVWSLVVFVPPLAVLALLVVELRYRWLYQSAPLEQTEWASLAPRVEEWARLAKSPYRETRVTLSGTLGFRDGNVSGLFKRTLYLSGGLLRNTDWRQQDAFVTYLFTQSRRRRLIYASNLGISLVTIIALLGLFYTQLVYADSLLATLVSGFVVFLLLVAILVARTILLVRLYRGNNRLPFYCDRVAAELTGDPVAVMVLLNTINQISGGFLGAVNPYDPGSSNSLLLQRMGQLDAMMRQPGPRAPWAYQPVPSMTPVFLGPVALTVPYQPSTPGPVPGIRYPVAQLFIPAAMPFIPEVPVRAPTDSSNRSE